MPDSHGLPEVDVLIVEDQAPVRSVMCDILEKAGYSFQAVENGLAALAAVRQARYRAIICDVGMPLVDGVRFHEILESRDPDLAKRVLFVSAVAGGPEVRELLTRTGRPLLQKPFEIRALVRAIAQMVDRPPTPGALL
jgi:two-component system NtrC family sensor kinase